MCFLNYSTNESAQNKGKLFASEFALSATNSIETLVQDGQGCFSTMLIVELNPSGVPVYRPTAVLLVIPLRSTKLSKLNLNKPNIWFPSDNPTFLLFSTSCQKQQLFRIGERGILHSALVWEQKGKCRLVWYTYLVDLASMVCRLGWSTCLLWVKFYQVSHPMEVNVMDLLKFCTLIVFYNKTLNPKFQASVTSGSRVTAFKSSDLEAVLGPTFSRNFFV